MATQYPILQSGFLSYPTDDLVFPETEGKNLGVAILMKDYLTPKSTGFFNKPVEMLYEDSLRTPALVNDFDFQERIIKAASAAFGAPVITDWLALQVNTPSVTIQHRNFLLDTLNYVSGQGRRMDPALWFPLLSSGNVGPGVSIMAAKYFIADDGGYALPQSKGGFLAHWLGQPGGTQDLLTSLRIIFGKRRKVVG